MQPCPLAKTGCASGKENRRNLLALRAKRRQSGKIFDLFSLERAEGLAPKSKRTRVRLRKQAVIFRFSGFLMPLARFCRAQDRGDATGGGTPPLPREPKADEPARYDRAHLARSANHHVGMTPKKSSKFNVLKIYIKYLSNFNIILHNVNGVLKFYCHN